MPSGPDALQMLISSRCFLIHCIHTYIDVVKNVDIISLNCEVWDIIKVFNSKNAGEMAIQDFSFLVIICGNVPIRIQEIYNFPFGFGLAIDIFPKLLRVMFNFWCNFIFVGFFVVFYGVCQ